MRDLKLLAGGAAAVWLIFKAIDLAEAGMTRLIMMLYGYDYAHAVVRAPVAVWFAVFLLLGLGGQLWLLWQENKSYKRSAQEHQEQAAKPSGKRKAG